MSTDMIINETDGKTLSPAQIAATVTASTEAQSIWAATADKPLTMDISQVFEETVEQTTDDGEVVVRDRVVIITPTGAAYSTSAQAAIAALVRVHKMAGSFEGFLFTFQRRTARSGRQFLSVSVSVKD
jgi:hypothetical protein